MYIETHCHLDYLKQASTAELIELATEQNIEKIITIAVSPDNFDAVEEITQKFENVYGTLGVHPHDAMKFTDETLANIKERIQKNKKIKAVGEIGLDYHYDRSPRHIQIKTFEKQIALSIELNLPIVVHSRDADKDTMAVFKNFAKDFQGRRPGVVHSFTSSQELADFSLDLGFYIGFNGIITFKNANEVRDVLEKCPLNRILYETDSPFLTPAPNRGKENAPHYLPHVAAKCAEVKGIEIASLNATVKQNSVELFRI